MAKLKDRRAAHRLVAELLRNVFHKKGKKVSTDCSAEVKVEIERIREAHFAAGTHQDDLPDDFEVYRATIGFGGVYRCQSCGDELNDKSQRFCSDCQSSKNGEAHE